MFLFVTIINSLSLILGLKKISPPGGLTNPAVQSDQSEPSVAAAMPVHLISESESLYTCQVQLHKRMLPENSRTAVKQADNFFKTSSFGKINSNFNTFMQVKLKFG
ncbi:MAG: hypothetical protein DRI57_04915 [Deltaproteobacteria bacterium]|nr:MAG: hypothetical protein DRI57_04915 [Deltaproteobacteria bacterium]